MPSAIVPAAGAASRFGGDKLATLIDGIAMLDRTISSLLAAGCDDVVVVVPPDAVWVPSIAALASKGVRSVVNVDPSRGMFSSIQLAAAAVNANIVAILPGDMPYVRTQTIRALIDEATRNAAIVVPRHAGRRGHPILVPGRTMGAIVAASAESTLSEVLKAYANAPRIEVDVDDPGVVRDVDVREDLRA